DQAVHLRDVQGGVGADAGDLRGVGEEHGAAARRGGGALDRRLTRVGIAHDPALGDPGAAQHGAVDVQVGEALEDPRALRAAVVAVELAAEHDEIDLGRGGEQLDHLERAGDHGEVEVHEPACELVGGGADV